MKEMKSVLALKVFVIFSWFPLFSMFLGKEEEVGVMIHHILFQCSLFLEFFNVNEVVLKYLISKMFLKQSFCIDKSPNHQYTYEKYRILRMTKSYNTSFDI